MSAIRAPSEARIKRAALKNRAVRECIARPHAECPELCTESAILEGLPVVVVCEFGYSSTSLYDFENGNLPHGMGEVLEVRPLEEFDEFDPRRVLFVYRATLPKGSIGRKEPKRKPRATRPAVELTPEDNDELARELGIL